MIIGQTAYKYLIVGSSGAPKGEGGVGGYDAHVTENVSCYYVFSLLALGGWHC